MTPALADRYINLPPERLISYGMLRQTLGRDLDEQELEEFIERGEAGR